MKTLLFLVALTAFGCADQGLLPAEGGVREIWGSTDRLATAKNRASALLDKARDIPSIRPAVVRINRQTVACTDALPLSDPKRMTAFQSRKGEMSDRDYLHTMAEFYNQASACYEKHNAELEGLL